MKPNLFIFIVSVCVIIFVHYLEYIGFTPCQLCFYQRWPWYLIILLSFISIFYNNNTSETLDKMNKSLIAKEIVNRVINKLN